MFGSERLDSGLAFTLEAITADDVRELLRRIQSPHQFRIHTQGERLAHLNIGILLVASEIQGISAIFSETVLQFVFREQRAVIRLSQARPLKRGFATDHAVHRPAGKSRKWPLNAIP